VDQLKTVFTAPLYTGCKDDGTGYAKPGSQKPRGTRFWVSLIALFSGMRLKEICQLDVSDIRQSKGGCWYFSVNDEGEKSVKNEPSKRNIPIHPELIKLGLLNFVQPEANRGKLFKDLRISKQRYWSERMSRWFNGFLSHLGIKSKQIVFHSFRHSFKDALRRAEMPTAIEDALGGWSSLKGSSKNYGDGYSVDQLAEYIEKVTYDGLDLSHLHVTVSD
jgi:integrase